MDGGHLRFKTLLGRTRNRNEDGNLEMLSSARLVKLSTDRHCTKPGAVEESTKHLAVSPGNLVLIRCGFEVAYGVSEARR